MEVVDGGRAVELGPRMPRAVLALLLMEVNRVVSLDALVDRLWGGEPPPTANAALQGYVSNLRRALEPHRPRGTPARVLATRAPGYVLHASTDAVDALRFERLARVGRIAVAEGKPEAAREALRAGLALWRGGPYADLVFESFVQPEVARLTELRARASEDLAEADLELGDCALAVSDLERLLEADALRERRWELLALAYYRNGRQASALAALRRARTVLVEQLGVEPGPALRRLETDILAQSPSLDARPPGDGTRTVRIVETGGPAEGLLVGRDSELAALAAALEDVCAGRSRVVLLSGEPGIGKTRLAEALSTRARGRGALVAWGSCHDAGAAPPFWPWVQLIGALARRGDAPEVCAALGRGASSIAQMVPEVKDVEGLQLAPVPMTEPEAARTLLYDAVAGFVRRLADTRPVVLVIDDLHWADVASLQLLEVVCRAVIDAAVLVVCTFREAEAGTADAVMGAVGHLGRQAGALRLRPAGLNDADVAALVREAVGGPGPPGLAEAICARTEGNPFFVSELVALVRSGGKLEGEAVPAGARDAIRLRLARLPDDAGELLAAGAVIGRSFGLELVAAMTRTDEERALDLFELALRDGVLVDDPQASGSLRFSHDLVRETIYGGLSRTRRARMHRRAGDALERLRPVDPPLAELAHHYWEGVGAGAVDEAVTYAMALADQATARFAFELAEHQLRRALDLLESTPVTDQAQRALDAQIRLSSVLAVRHGHASPDVGRALACASELSQAVGDSARLLGALRGAFVFAYVAGNLDEAESVGIQLRNLWGLGGEVAFLAAAELAAGTVNLARGQLVEARTHLQQAVALAGPHDLLSPEYVMTTPPVAARTRFALDLWLLGEVPESDRLMEEATAMAREAGVVSLVDTLFVAGVRHAAAGDPAAVLRSVDEALALADRHGLVLYGAGAGVLRGWARAMQDVGMAVAEAEQALTAVRATGAKVFLSFFLALGADGHARAGDHAAALAAVDAGLAEVDGGGEGFWAPELHRLRGILLAATGGAAGAAEASVRQAIALARAQSAPILVARAEATLAQLQAPRLDGRDNRPSAWSPL